MVGRCCGVFNKREMIELEKDDDEVGDGEDVEVEVVMDNGDVGLESINGEDEDEGTEMVGKEFN